MHVAVYKVINTNHTIYISSDRLYTMHWVVYSTYCEQRVMHKICNILSARHYTFNVYAVCMVCYILHIAKWNRLHSLHCATQPVFCTRQVNILPSYSYPGSKNQILHIARYLLFYVYIHIYVYTMQGNWYDQCSLYACIYAYISVQTNM